MGPDGRPPNDMAQASVYGSAILLATCFPLELLFDPLFRENLEYGLTVVFRTPRE